jgi:DNA-binding response OmpR family regulator
LSAAAVTVVLYVEDEVLIREMAATALEDAGFEVVIAENGDAALDMLDGNATRFRAIITDVNLGAGPDGWVIAGRARELNRELPVVYVSGASSHEWQSKGVRNSVMITKPFTLQHLVRVTSALIQGADRASQLHPRGNIVAAQGRRDG